MTVGPIWPTRPQKDWHSGQETIFGVCPYEFGLRWDISGHPYRGFAQNFDTFYMGIVVLPGEPFWEKSPKIKKMNFLRKWTCPKIQKMLISRKKAAGGQRPLGSQKLLRILAPYEISLFYRKLKKVTFSKKVRCWWKISGQSQTNDET